jgi:NitT/TauT family transport system substrate-binding protein
MTGFAAAAVSRDANAADLETVRLQDFGVNVISMPEFYARTFGLFEKQGVNVVSNAPIFNTAGIMQTVITGQADIGYTGATTMVPAVAQGRDIISVANIAQGMEMKLSLTKAAAEKLAQKGITPNSPFKDRLLALHGLRLCAPATGSTTYQGIQYELKKNGVDAAKDVIIQPIADMASQIAAMRQGAVDGMFGTFGSGIGNVEADGAVRFISFEQEDAVLPMVPWNVLVVSKQYLKTHGDAVRRTVAAFYQAKLAIRRGLTADELDTVKKKFFPDMNPDTYKTIYGRSIQQLTGGLVATKAQFDTLVDINNVGLDAPVKVNFNQVFDNHIAEQVEKQ